ncbi:COG1470 family protein [Wenzhouxiangella marina]|uniref:Uncharacterized protein n=1 Tax=Wenzhouxiangella marina TaxID=1579979 RepID=A0A0K0XVY2_9GAMM|nr:FG-GAP repeat protein [Wenzhouxiangella marina]AKS41782.1 hypothetical protein WM2015_1410 [Wenzhouxiangella marina]MBB6086456.1 hypothetical protein [Wenzhouxiangella marina]
MNSSAGFPTLNPNLPSKVAAALFGLGFLLAAAAEPNSPDIELLVDATELGDSSWTALEADLDQDGHADLIIGLPDAGQQRGRVLVLYGPTEQWPRVISLATRSGIESHALDGEWPGDRFGTSLGVIKPHVHGQHEADSEDHRLDLLVGAPGAEVFSGFDARGSIYRLSGSRDRTAPHLDALGLEGNHRLMPAEGQHEMGQQLITIEGSTLALATLPGGKETLMIRSPSVGPQASYRSSQDTREARNGPLQASGRMSAPVPASHRQYDARGGRMLRLSESSQLIEQRDPATGLARLRYRLDGLTGTGPLINLGAGIADQFVLAGAPLQLEFEVSDPVDPPADLTLEVDVDTGSTLINPNSLTLGGTDALRTLSIETLTGNPDGSTPITVRVFNLQGLFSEATFQVNVLNNSIPEINGGLGLPDQQVSAGGTVTLPFTLDDLLFDPDLLSINVSSSDPTLVSPTSIVLTGTGPNRSMSIPTLPGSSGQATITLEVTNPLNQTTSASFLLDVQVPAGAGPLINNGAGIAPQSAVAGQRIDLPFTISDPFEPAAALTVNVQSGNPAILPNDALLLSGLDEQRLLQILTVNGQSGDVAVTLQVSNSQGLSSTETFPVRIQPRPAPQINFGQAIPARSGRPGDVVEWSLTVTDPFDPPASLQLEARSADPQSLPDTAIQVLGTTTSRVLRVAVPDDAAAGEFRLGLRLSNSAGLSSTATAVLNVEAGEGPLINGGEPLPDQAVPPGRRIQFEVQAEPIDPGVDITDLRVYSLDQDILPDEAINLVDLGDRWLIEIDTALSQPGTTRVVVEARGSDGGISRSSFELIITADLTELEIATEELELRVGPQRFLRIDVRNIGEHPAAEIDLRLSSTGDSELLSVVTLAQDCRISDGNAVRCDERPALGWECVGGSENRRCRLDGIDPDELRGLILGLDPGSEAGLMIEASASNAPSVSTLHEPESD